MPIQQKARFDKMKALLMQYKSVATINKKFNELKLGVLDIMSGLDGMDRYSTKLTDIKITNFSDYHNSMLSSSFAKSQKQFDLKTAKLIVKRKYAKANNPFGGDRDAIKSDIEHLTKRDVDKPDHKIRTHFAKKIVSILNIK